MFPVTRFDSLDSTNLEAKRLLSAEAISEPCIIRADAQTAGRGTRGHRWISPPGAGLYFSIVHPLPGVRSLREFNPEMLEAGDFTDWSLFTLAAGVACAEALRERTGVPVVLKPINDLYVDSCKLGGILCESLIREEIAAEGFSACRGLITGIGINVLEHDVVHEGCRTEQREDNASNHPTSLQAWVPPALFRQWDPEVVKSELCQAVAGRVDQEYRALLRDGRDALLQKYQRYQIVGWPAK